MPSANKVTMQHFLDEFVAERDADEHAVMVLDGAGWHDARALDVGCPPIRRNSIPSSASGSTSRNDFSPTTSTTAMTPSSRPPARHGTISPQNQAE